MRAKAGHPLRLSCSLFLFASLSGAAGACSFPDVSYATAGDDGADGIAEASVPDGGTTESPEAATVVDATVDAAADATVDALVASEEAPPDGNEAAPAQGDAGQDGGEEAAPGPDCDCGVGSLYPTGVQCGLLGLGLVCTQSEGFVNVYQPCGTMGEYVTCKAQGVGCVTDTDTQKVQQCH